MPLENRPFDLRAFSRRNAHRSIASDGFRHPIMSWSEHEWFVAAAGEFGELGGALKELLRARDAVPGKGHSPEQIVSNIADEIADVVIYLDLLAQRCGIDLASAIEQKFDRVSEKIGYADPYRSGD